ncbi:MULTISPECIES: hypothetical protein [unclassified Sporosarcina]|uniref:hypothetical protein n=1 Tax=unclassified Sporosarcina TaxID=2647733 RepID=UPI00203D277C|nr:MULTISPECIES: hypothetical protein [unclassified Sporosarcina]GKV65232.1 hypothetical protein NCCP2331_13850 [Sporosarcina sp. NCCP-2331]GLB55356.1 hypothetical protein NCCP2378_11430 [Sporosarcina sp. NCCP-2378]
MLENSQGEAEKWLRNLMDRYGNRLTVLWSEKEDKESRDMVNDSKEEVYAYFRHFNEGVFHRTGKIEGTVEFEAAEKRDVRSIFNLIQNKNGIW